MSSKDRDAAFETERARQAAARDILNDASTRGENLDYTTTRGAASTAAADTIIFGPGDGSNGDVEVLDPTFLDGLDDSDDEHIECPNKESSPEEWQINGKKTQEREKKRAAKQSKRKAAVQTGREVIGKLSKATTTRGEGQKAVHPIGK